MFSALSLSVSAADGSENINTIDMNVSANVTIDTTPNVDGGVVTEDIEIQKSVVSGQSGFNGFIQYVFPTPTDVVNERRLLAEVCLDDNFSIVSGHEYNLNFTWGYNINLSGYSCGLLRFYNNDGEIIKEQNLFVSNGIKPSTLYNVDISFIPDTKDLTSGYRCELVLIFVQGGYNSTSQAQRFYISPEIVLIDKDDDSGWFQKILDAIKAIPNNIKSFFTNLGDRISGFFDDLGLKFDNMKESVVNAFVTLKDDLLGGLEALFIPADDYFDRKSDEMQQWGADHFGFLWELSDLLISTVQNLKGLLQDGYVFIFPAAEFDLNGEHYVLWEEYEVPVSQYIEDVSALKYAYNTYLIVISGICGVALFNYARKTFDKVTAN